MQVDMHYYGTYAMARAAGLSPADCRIIVIAAQFVDDNAGKDTIWFADGARLDVDATAHHAFDVANIDPEDQRHVWVPFHFIPGNRGTEYTERLICRQDSQVVRELKRAEQNGGWNGKGSLIVESRDRSAECGERHGLLGPGADRVRCACVCIRGQGLRGAGARAGRAEAGDGGSARGHRRRAGAAPDGAYNRPHQGGRGAGARAVGGEAREWTDGGGSCSAIHGRSRCGSLQAEDGEDFPVASGPARPSGARQGSGRRGGARAGHGVSRGSRRVAHDGEHGGEDAVAHVRHGGELGACAGGDQSLAVFAKYPAGRRERYLTDVEFERLGRFLDEAERGGGGASVSAVAALRLLMLTGCRKGEILTLKWEDVDLGAGELRLADAKTGARTVSLAPEVARVLEGIPRVSGVPWVITGKRSGTYMRKLDDAWLRLRARAGLEDVRIHDLSHRCASRALALGESLPMIGRLLGHREIETTARYAHHCARLRARRGSPGSQQHLGGHSVGVGRGRGGPVNPKARLFGVWM